MVNAKIEICLLIITDCFDLVVFTTVCVVCRIVTDLAFYLRYGGLYFNHIYLIIMNIYYVVHPKVSQCG